MSHFVPFPGAQPGQVPPGAQFGPPQGPYGPPPPQGQPAPFIPYMQAQSGYPQVPPPQTHHQTGPPGYGGQPTPLQPGAYAAVKLPDGTYAPVMAQMIDGKLQYVTTGSPPGGGGRTMQPQPTGYAPSQGYGEMYRAANDPDSAKSVKEWARRQEREKARTDKETAKKLREWERDQRAREEAEAKYIAAHEKDRKNERLRRLSVSSGLGFDRDRKISGGMSEMDRRFANMAVNQPPAAGFGGHSRRLSTSEGEFGHNRSHSGSYFQTPSGSYRSRPPSPLYGQSSPNPGPPLGVAIPGVGPGKPPYGGRHSTSPGKASGQFVMTNGQMAYGPPSAVGPYPTTSPYSKHPAPGASPRSTRFLAPPPAFFREPSRSQPYARFDNFAIVWDIKEMLMGSPPLPALLLPCDVQHADWDRCMADLTAAWKGEPPYDLSIRPFSRPPRKVRHPGSAVCDVVDIWNVSFFAARGVDLVLYRGLERHSGASAGRRDQRLPRKMVPSQYITATRKRDRPTRQNEETSSDSSSSSESDAETDEDEDDYEASDSDDDPPYARAARGYPNSVGGRDRSRSRAASRTRPGPGVDQPDRWIVASRDAKRTFRAARDRERRNRRRERRKRRVAKGDMALYSLHVFCRPRA